MTKTYSVACLWFIPGFAFLGYADQAIATPRRANPRGGRQCRYCQAANQHLPGGFTGRLEYYRSSPKTLYDPGNSLISIGDTVQFYAISPAAFRDFKSP